MNVCFSKWVHFRLFLVCFFSFVVTSVFDSSLISQFSNTFYRRSNFQSISKSQNFQSQAMPGPKKAAKPKKSENKSTKKVKVEFQSPKSLIGASSPIPEPTKLVPHTLPSPKEILSYMKSKHIVDENEEIGFDEIHVSLYDAIGTKNIGAVLAIESALNSAGSSFSTTMRCNESFETFQ